MSNALRLASSAVLVLGLLGACGSPPPAAEPCSIASATPPPSAVTAAPPPAVASSAAAAPAAALGPELLSVMVTNAAATARAKETITLEVAELVKLAPTLEIGKVVVYDAAGAPVLSQLVSLVHETPPSQLVFQTDLAAGETKTFQLRVGERVKPPASAYHAYGRFVRERFDDFAWENDLVAHRMYGAALEASKKEPLVSSGIDVWAKRSPRLLINEWYLTDDYHHDYGDGADLYSVGKTRGCGGLGIWAKEKLFVSHNFIASRVLADGPIRLVFELDYAPWDAGGVKISETKRVTLDAGSAFNRFESTFKFKGAPAAVALGIAKHEGGVPAADVATGSLRVWEPADGKNGFIGCAIVLPPGTSGLQQQTEQDYLFVTAAKPEQPLVYYVGSTWDRSGRVSSADGWGEAVHALSARLAAPVHVSVSPAAAAAPAVAAPAQPAK